MICKVTLKMLCFKAILTILMLSSKQCKIMDKMSTKKAINFTITNVTTFKKNKVGIISTFKKRIKKKNNKNNPKNKKQKNKKNNNK